MGSVSKRPGLTEKIYRTLSAFLLIVILFSGSSGNCTPIRQVTINYIDTFPLPEKLVNQIQLFVTVTDEAQMPILGLDLAHFSAIEDGTPIPLASAALSQDPMALILAIDTSGSMLAQDKSGKTAIEAAKGAAIQFIHRLSPEDKLAIYTFNNDTLLQQDFSIDHDTSLDILKRVNAKPRAATRLYDTALEAVKKASEIPSGRRAIVLLTDGKDEKAGEPYSTHNLSDVIDAATTKTIRVPVYTIGCGPNVDAKELGRLSALTGGRSLLAASPDELTHFYGIIASQLKNQYLLKYESQLPSGEHSVVVKVKSDIAQGQDERRFWLPPLPMPKAPSVVIESPKRNSKLSGTAEVRIQLSPKETVNKIRYYIDSVYKGELSGPEFESFSINFDGLKTGDHLLRIEAIDVRGQSGTAEVAFAVEVPVLRFEQPANGARVEGTVPVAINLSSGVALKKATFYVDGQLYEELTSPPFTRFDWDTSAYSPGLHLLAVEVIDINGSKGRAQISANLSGGYAQEIFSPLAVIGIVAAAIGLLGISVFLFILGKKRKKTGTMDQGKTGLHAEQLRDDDETIFMPDATSDDEPPPAELRVVKSSTFSEGHIFEIRGNIKIGRKDSNDIVIPDKSVSRKHAEIYFELNSYHIRDLGSTYGTVVDNQKIALDESILGTGSRIEFGPKTTMDFFLLDDSQPVAENDATLVSDSDTDKTLTGD